MARGLPFGAAVALGFALVISVLPDWFFQPKSLGLAVAFALGAAAAPPTVWSIWLATRPTPATRPLAVVAGGVGAMLFDGIAIGFAPGLYGQDEMGAVGAMLLFAFASLAIAGVVMTKAHRT
jgi:hypothetical protein